jgi:hypothetical protein
MRAILIVMLFVGSAAAGPKLPTARQRAIESAKAIAHLVDAAFAEQAPPPPPPPRVHVHPRGLWCGLSDARRDN